MIQLSDVYKYYRVDGNTRVILNHVSLTFDANVSYGLLGVNGSGKSTTLRLIAGTELPNSGKIRRSVRVSWPLGFSGGFHPDMTGRENVRFVARVYGVDLRKTEMFVEDFSELGDYMDAKVKTYSSGMMARLGFAMSMAVEFDVYLIDEVTAVGDANFQKKCRQAFAQRRKNSGLIIVSHSMQTISEYCERGGVIVDGKILMYPTTKEAVEVYNRLNR